MGQVIDFADPVGRNSPRIERHADKGGVELAVHHGIDQFRTAGVPKIELAMTGIQAFSG